MHFLGSLTARLTGVVLLIGPLVSFAFVLPPLMDGRRGFDFFMLNIGALGVAALILALAYQFLRRGPSERMIAYRAPHWSIGALYRLMLMIVVAAAFAANFGLISPRNQLFQLPQWREIGLAMLVIYGMFFLMCVFPGVYVWYLRRGAMPRDVARVFDNEACGFAPQTVAELERFVANQQQEQRVQPQMSEGPRPGPKRRPDTTVKKPALFWVFEVAIVLCAVLALVGTRFAYVIPPRDALIFVERFGAPITGVVIGILLTLTMHNQYKRLRKGWGQSMLLSVLVAGLLGALVHLGGARVVVLGGAMSLSYVLEGTPATRPVSIVRMGSENRRRGCDRSVVVRPVDWPDGQFRLCDVPKPVWSRLAPGSVLSVTGRQTWAGLMVTGYPNS